VTAQRRRRSIRGVIIPGLIIAGLAIPGLVTTRDALAGGGWIEMYPRARLAQEQPRFEQRVQQLYSILTSFLSGPERSALAGVRFEVPLADPANEPFAFYHKGPAVTMSVFSLLFVEDLCSAYAWLDRKGYSLETVDEYVAMLWYKKAADFPGGRYPAPLVALGIPPDALRDPVVEELSRRLRNSTYAFIMAHELGHIVKRHRGYADIPMAQARRQEAEADAFALDVLSRASEIPMGAVVFFQAQAYMMPSLGQFKAEGKTAQDWDNWVLKNMTHPLTADRLQALALGMEELASREPREAERETLRFIATRLAGIADALQDVDLQQCMAVAAARADPAVLAPQRPGPGTTAGFLGKCAKRR
jgi:uncharacterized protein DUF955